MATKKLFLRVKSGNKTSWEGFKYGNILELREELSRRDIQIDKDSDIGNNVYMYSGVNIHRSTIGDDVSLHNDSLIEDSNIGDNSVIGVKSRVINSVIKPNEIVGDGLTISNNAQKPEKETKQPDSTKEDIEWLKDFIKRWDEADNKIGTIYPLTVEYNNWRKPKGYPEISADELILDLQKSVVEDENPISTSANASVSEKKIKVYTLAVMAFHLIRNRNNIKSAHTISVNKLFEKGKEFFALDESSEQYKYILEKAKIAKNYISQGNTTSEVEDFWLAMTEYK